MKEGVSMSKRLPRRKFVGIMKNPPRIWVSEEEMKGDLDFLRKLHPGNQTEEAIQSLVDSGYISVRFTRGGKREFSFNKEAVQTALNKIPPEQRSNYEIKVHETIAIICEYDNELTTLLSVVIQQTNKLTEHKGVIPWIIKTHEQLTHDVLDITKDLQSAFNQLEAKNFVEIAENGPTQYKYRLNVPVVQAAINALPERND
jgi:hypothetical protein